MRFQHYQASKFLQAYIQGYLIADTMDSHEMGVHTLFPNGYSGIFFNFGNLGKLILKEEYKTPPVSIFGQIDRHFTVMHWPGFYSIGVLMKPAVLSRLFRLDMSEFTNKAFDGTLIHRNFKGLYQRLEEVPYTMQKIDLLNSYFSTLFKNPDNACTITDHALQAIHDQETISIENLAAHLNISQRYLEMSFKRTIGLSPKTYSLIVRFKRMEQQLKNIPTAAWHKMHFASSYHDQNHFIKDFKRFTGHTPSDYLLKNFELGRSYLLR